MSRKHSEHHEEHADETWLVPYSDLLTLLLALFIVLFAMGKTDEKNLLPGSAAKRPDTFSPYLVERYIFERKAPTWTSQKPFPAAIHQGFGRARHVSAFSSATKS